LPFEPEIMLKKYWLNQGKVVDNGEGEAQV